MLPKCCPDNSVMLSGCDRYAVRMLPELVSGCDRNMQGVNRWLEEVYRPAFSELELHHFYRALDLLAEHKERVETELFKRTQSLFNMKVDIVFWDTTSTYFEGKGPDELGCYGYSKDHRPDRVQVMIGVVMTQMGIRKSP